MAAKWLIDSLSLQSNLQLQEKEVYSQRQMLLSEIESVRQREAEVKREGEVNKRYVASVYHLFL